MYGVTAESMFLIKVKASCGLRRDGRTGVLVCTTLLVWINTDHNEDWSFHVGDGPNDEMVLLMMDGLLTSVTQVSDNNGVWDRGVESISTPVTAAKIN